MLNPAGIDLADGTFWDGLQLADNSWVTGTYLWTGTGPIGTVRTKLVTVRRGPGRVFREVGLAAEHAELLVECTTGRWLRIGAGQFVPAARVSVRGSVPVC